MNAARTPRRRLVMDPTLTLLTAASSRCASIRASVKDRRSIRGAQPVDRLLASACSTRFAGLAMCGFGLYACHGEFGGGQSQAIQRGKSFVYHVDMSSRRAP